MSEIEDRVQRVIRRLVPRQRPGGLYHYTSGTGLLGILQSRAVWATGIRFLNDAQEFNLAIELATEIAKERLDKATTKLNKGLYQVIADSISLASGFEVYVSSFSERGDQLSQWRGYCPPGAGYALGFNPKALSQLVEGARFLAPCVYGISNTRPHVERLFAEVEDFANSLLPQLRGNHDRLYRESFKLFSQMLPVVAPILKDESFDEEKEWRLVSRARAFDGVSPSFRMSRSTLVPYHEHPVLLLTEGGLVEVIVGPTPHPDLAVGAAELLLESSGYPAVPVRRSSIPFRAW